MKVKLNLSNPGSCFSGVPQLQRYLNPTSVDMEKIHVLALEPRWLEWGVKEAVHIRVVALLLKRDGEH